MYGAFATPWRYSPHSTKFRTTVDAATSASTLVPLFLLDEPQDVADIPIQFLVLGTLVAAMKHAVVRCRSFQAAIARYFSRPASCTVFCTGDNRYSITVRLPRLTSAVTCIPGAIRCFRPSLSRYDVFSDTSAR